MRTVEFEILVQGFEKPSEEVYFMITAQILNHLRIFTNMSLSEKQMGEALRKANFKRVQKRINNNYSPVYGYRIKIIKPNPFNQDRYAEAMAKYVLQRGVRRSEARHISTSEHYRNQKEESDNLQIDIDLLIAQQETSKKNIEQLQQQKEEAKLNYVQAEIQKQLKEAELRETEQTSVRLGMI